MGDEGGAEEVNPSEEEGVSEEEDVKVHDAGEL